MDKKQKPNMLIIGNPHSNPSTKAFLIKFLTVLSPLAEEIYVISGDDPRFYDNVRWLKMKKSMYKSLPKKIISFLSFQLKLSFGLIKISKMVDVVIFFPSTMIVPVFAAKLKRVKIILYAGGSASKNMKCNGGLIRRYILFAIFRILENLSFAFSDEIIIESKSSLEFEGLKRYRDKVVVSGIYVDTDIFSCETEIKKRKDKIGYIGILSELKGVLNFVKAISDISEERDKIKFLVGGDGPLRDKIEEYLDENDLNDNVKFIGWISHDELPEYLNELKLIVLPSYTEGLPNILLEAMACGTPVLATPVGAIPDLIKDGETGFIMENNLPECIAKNVIRALNHPNLEKIAENARKLVEKEFTYATTMKRYRKILDNLGVENYGQRKII
jgi:glycosyltransferase involved in cell wall biosynthesis